MSFTAHSKFTNDIKDRKILNLKIVGMSRTKMNLMTYNYVDIEINNEIEPVNNDHKLMKIMNNKVKISSSELELGEYRYICKITKSK